MKRAIIGNTGFVGGFLASQMPFTSGFNSKNIADIRGQSFDEVICAGVSAVKWKANKEPEQDRAGIKVLEDCLREVQAQRFVLISTVDVFGNPQGVDETSAVETENLHPYGLHRYQFEQFIQSRFADTLVVRLPALFGPGLRKNALYDLLHDNQVNAIPRRGVFQWYDLRRLPDDLARAKGLSLVHLMPEPLEMRRIIETLFGDKAEAGHDNPAAHYDTRTIHAERFGGQGAYIDSAANTLRAMGEWVATERCAKEQEKSACA